MDPTLFVGEVPDRFSCAICLEIVKDPQEHEDCQRLFCGQCVTRLESNDCPLCRSPLEGTLKALKTEDQEVYGGLTMRCAHVGCNQTFLCTQLSEHEATCPVFPLLCSIPGCGQLIPRSAMSEHMQTFNDEHLRILSERVETQTQQISGLERSLAEKDEKLATNQETINRLYTEHDNMEAKLGLNNIMMSRNNSELEGLSKSHQTLKKRNDELEQMCDELRTERYKELLTNEEIKFLNRQIQELTDKVTALEASVQRLERDKKSQSEEIQRLTKAVPDPVRVRYIE
jgi:DNA repair exonuclease SbcCD ATPase subunit